MEFLTPFPSTKPQILSSNSLFSPTPSLKTLHNKTLFKSHKPHFIRHSSNPLYPSNSRLPNSKITAHFGKPSKRRNSLRKKLTHEYFQVRENPTKIIEVSEPNLDKNELERDNGVMGSEEIDSGSVNFEGSNGLGESVMRDKLDSWVEQYNKDIAFWGIGSNPIFTVVKDSSGSVERVLVDQDEILRRSGVEPLYFKEGKVGLEEFGEVRKKIDHAKFLAKEMEFGKDVGLKNSSLVKFVSKGENLGFVGRVRSMNFPPNLVPKVGGVGIGLFCGFVFVWVVKKLFMLRGESKVTKFEEEMMRRKIRARMAKEKLKKGSVEVVEEDSSREDDEFVVERPKLDKGKVLDSIRKAKVGLNDNEVDLVSGGGVMRDFGLDVKIQEIQMMARRARKIERKEESDSEADELDNMEDHENVVNVNRSFTKPSFVNGVIETESLGDKTIQNGDMSCIGEKGFEGNEDLEQESSSSGGILEDDDDKSHKLADTRESSQLPASTNGAEVSTGQERSLNGVAERRKPKIILSVREAREYLSKKDDQMSETNDVPSSITIENEGVNNHTKSFSLNGVSDPVLSTNVSEFHSFKENGYSPTDVNETNKVAQTGSMRNGHSEPQSTEDSNMDAKPNLDDMTKVDGVFKHRNASETLEIVSGANTYPDSRVMERACLQTEENPDIAERLDEMPNLSNLEELSDHFPDNSACSSTGKSSEATDSRDESVNRDVNLAEKAYIQADKSSVKAGESTDGNDLQDLGSEKNAFFPNGLNGDVACETRGENKEEGQLANENKWLEKNFHEVEPIVQKIGGGFRNNYMVAREKAKEEMDVGFDFMNLSMNDDTELEWMQDEKLREIVFRVRDNELAGRDPFHSMDPEDKVAFFEGLERKVQKQNEKLATLHEWLHSNIENVDYGADGISLYDPPEKVIPRWKGPPIDKIPEFLNNAAVQHHDASFLQRKKDKESSNNDNNPVSSKTSITNPRPNGKVTKTPRTVIEASDGSTKAGKKSGKEFYQHTKKLSPGFVESYNAESDPEVKSVMKDIGKDLDRWITEKEIQEAADVMDRIPQRAKEIVDKKLSKVRREMELFGPAAVVSKYSEYAEEKEEDYLWWLDLPYVLCIEMYTYEGEEQQVGFYSLEMATDLEIDPKPNHVIAFEDPGDCKNLCYIIQAHLEMLGKGQAFVVAQTPKDAFREAKANGFGVTVIRKGELKLNIDQPLEEVEELITEIGSKMYHDKLMKGRSVDISALMKGVFGISHPSKRRRKKRALKKPKKP